MVISILDVKYRRDYLIEIEFADGVIKTIDFGPFLKNAHNPMTTHYLDKEKFASFSLEYGDLMWNDFDMCFPIWDLYQGNI